MPARTDTHTHTPTHAHAHPHTRARARARTRTHTPANAHGRTPRLPGVAESGINARRRSWAESAFHTERVKHSRRQRVSTPMRMGLAGTLWAWPRAGRCCAISVALPLSTMSATMADSYYAVLRQIGRGGPLGYKPCLSAHCKGVPRAVSLVFRLTVRDCLGRPSQGTTGRSETLPAAVRRHGRSPPGAGRRTCGWHRQGSRLQYSTGTHTATVEHS